ncbi:hypothetical protein KFL_015450010, partial [Klebsormidium nitens]
VDPKTNQQEQRQEEQEQTKKQEQDKPAIYAMWLTYDFLRIWHHSAFKMLRDEQKKLKPEREKIVVAMQDIIVRFGAVWIERVTLGGQHISTRTEELVADTRSREKTRTSSASLGGHEAGAAARFSVSAGKSKQAQAETSKNTRTSEVHATGGDTITFQSDNRTDWIHSICATQNWRIIRYRKIQELSTAPGLDVPLFGDLEKDHTDLDDTWKSIDVRELLRRRLKVVAEDVAELEAEKVDVDPSARELSRELLYCSHCASFYCQICQTSHT